MKEDLKTYTVKKRCKIRSKKHKRRLKIQLKITYL